MNVEVLKFQALVLVLLIVVVVRTVVVPSKQIGRLAHTPETVYSKMMAKDLAGVIPFQTISDQGGGTLFARRYGGQRDEVRFATRSTIPT